MIAFVVAVVAIAAIWLIGEQDIARHELIIKSSASAVIILFFPFVWGWKFFTIPKKSWPDCPGNRDPLRDCRAFWRQPDPHCAGNA